MSITLEINNKQLNSNDNQLNLHYLPAKIQGDGPANVEKYFNPYTHKDQGILSNALRGYPLQGEILKVPEGFKGLVVQETRKPLDEEADRLLRIKGSFEEFTYWNYDKIPSVADGYKQALQILRLAEELAEPCTEEDVLKEMEEYKKAKAVKSEK
ncbi:ribonuclease H2 subunit C [Lucilia cuprina]|uniref:ribonuclease H2 subunit C n=1 Tax=Lucilia cuprina TaxID=7375 RepID=UPI001F0624D9|nr:ribonuclease H2 subunit C [Lucilia cuprina]